ncbi:ABC transporter substrate-binding protein [Bradyrhizobium tropiciagri]|uniref:ABC transporter substrate-binding protein n=1 Tax=Bradyrhizobium tropiciagri TaxID=312253 RepID=UPI001BAE0816|nr:ABC transporter substrate-binding protein [Bradyrhizobium tropiciagri]MBR0874148.1 ABC transporter substrate-binding protein [Bradyrhizobium tropiciagri]
MRGVKLVVAAVGLWALSGAVRAEISGSVVKIGVLNDQSGLFADATGQGSVVAAQLAIDDFRASHPAIKVELLVADHQNKADTGASIARRWKDVDGIDAIVDVPNSAVALALNELLRNSNVAYLPSSAATTELTGASCSPNTVQWVFDTYALANSTGRAVTRAGGDSWYFVTTNFAFGTSLESEASRVIAANGGKVLGAVKHPLNTSDFSSYLLSAQTSGAKIIGLANVGGDTVNALKQAAEFGIGGKAQQVAALLIFINDVHSLGLSAAQGLLLTTAFYWDLNDQTRAWSKRFFDKAGRMPNMNHAGVYSTVLAYLAAVAARDSDNGLAAVAELKRMEIKDPLFANVKVRADGRVIHDMYLARVKTPAQSKKPWDYYEILATTPAAEAFKPLEDGKCPLISQ